MTDTDKNKKAIEKLNLMQEKCCDGYEAEAIYFGVKALRIVELIEETFKRDSNLMMDIEDWNEIKEFVENTKESENDG